MAFLTDCFLTQSTGINQYHKKYFDSVGAKEGFFRGKATSSWNKLSVVHEDNEFGESGNYIHLPVPAMAASNADFFCYTNTGNDTVMRVNRITRVIPINDQSCKVSFVEDAWNTWIPYINFGWCWVERQHPKEDPIGEYNVAEPIEFTQYDVCSDSNGMNINIKISQANENLGYYLFLTSDTYEWDGSLSPMAVFGTIHLTGANQGVVKSIDEIAAKLKSFVKGGWTKVYQQPVMANMARLVMAPMAADGVGIREKINSTFVPSFKPRKWNKVYMPQFLRWTVVARSTGQSISLNYFDRTNSGDKVFAYSFTISLLGVLAPYWSLACDLPSGDDSPSVYSVKVANQVPYPEIETLGMMRDNYTALGYAQDIIGGALGVGVNASQIEGRVAGGGDYGRAIAAGAAVMKGGAAGISAGLAIAVGAAQGAYSAFQKDQNYKSYVHAGTSDGATALRTGRMLYAVVETRPTAEALTQIEDFFETYGYQQNRRLKLELMTRGNYTYTKIMGGATFTSDLAPAWAITEITAILEGGITNWAVDIGSTKDCG